MRTRLDALIVAATAGEVARLGAALVRRRRQATGCQPVTIGWLAGRRVGLLCAGLGKANTALALGAALSRVEPALLLAVGMGGAYAGSGLEPGDLAVASEEIYGDEGVETAEGWKGLESIGIPLWSGPDGRVHWNRLPAAAPEGSALLSAARSVGHAAAGPFVTVSTVTGTEERAAWLARRFGAVCESMEGAAAAHAALAWRVPFGEVRGISNRVGPRDRASWKLTEAAAAAQEAAEAFLRAWSPTGPDDPAP
ncbi:MAG: futalosine hydrolase [Deltaproteobacteria bacterium]|nr:futalosine hydrolase [Deltaproteobacteria bacterium]